MSDVPTATNNDRWRSIGVLAALVLALLGWAYSLGIMRQTMLINARDISIMHAEVSTMRQANLELSREVSELTEAVRALNRQLDRRE